MIQDFATFLALANFAFVASITPGPNNFMVMASGAAFGWHRTLPHMVGIAVGFSTMIGAVVLGLGAALQEYPQALTALQIAGVVWLLWLAWKLTEPALQPATAEKRKTADQPSTRPLRLHEAAVFQWVNPKAWTMAVASSAAYAGVSSSPVGRVIVMVATFSVAAMICNSVWVLAGRSLQPLMTTGNSARLVSLFMAVLVVLSAFLIVLS